MNNRVFYSYKVGLDLINTNTTKEDNTFSIYYQIKDQVLKVLKNKDIVLEEVIRPEIYKHDIAFRFLTNFKKNDIHLIFKPIKDVRLLKHAYNIIFLMQENIKTIEQYDITKPFSNKLRMLKLIDEIWVDNTEIKSFLKTKGFQNVYHFNEQEMQKHILELLESE